MTRADGRLLGFTNHRSPDRVRQLLHQSLVRHEPVSDIPPLLGEPDPRFARTPPTGGLVVRVTAKVLGGYPPPETERQAIFQNALSRDHLWIRRDEHEALARGEFPRSLQKRIAKFHLVDNTRGEPPMWSDEEIRDLQLSLEDGMLQGTVHLETATGDRGYQAELVGILETSEEKVTRFDLVARGQFWGEGRFTRNAPPGKFPLGIAFTIAPEDDEMARVAPQGSRGWLDGYLR